jgi:hypothetical protein
MSGIVLCSPLIYMVSIAPPPHQHHLGLGHCYTNLLIFTCQLFRHQLGDLGLPALLHLLRRLYIEYLRYIYTFATYMCRLDCNCLIAHIYTILDGFIAPWGDPCSRQVPPTSISRTWAPISASSYLYTVVFTYHYCFLGV